MSAKSAAAMSAVIDGDDLLREILLCLGLSTLLVRAAVVSKRWLRLASDPAFLRRFRARNPPRLLGFFIYNHSPYAPRTDFVPVSADPGLAVAGSAAAESAGLRHIFDCRNGRLLLSVAEEFDGRLAVCYPLSPTRADHALPPLPRTLPCLPGVHTKIIRAFLLPRDGDDGIVFVAFPLPAPETFPVQACVLQSGAWGEAILATAELPAPYPIVTDLMHVHGKLYMATDKGYILRLDLATARMSTMNLPSGIGTNFRLAYKDGSGLFLVHVKGFVLGVWRNESDGDGDGAHDWVLVDTIRLVATGDRLEEVLLLAAGDDAGFVLLGRKWSGAISFVDLRRREEEKVDCKILMFFGRANFFPFTTVWPPVFPAVDEEDDYVSFLAFASIQSHA
uniref:Uncharacterized protein n=1 Tax=Avena sativa TaxID=4498 RepID=A0ACD5TFR6_AVESA